jgi:hypothetical protein
MSILDDAIREHLELKRAHGADEAELKRLEDDAFGPPQRPGEPDSFTEAPTEFLVAPGGEEAAGGDEGGRRVPNLTDLQEPPAPQAPESAAALYDAAADDGADEEEHPAGEHEPIAETGPNTEERHAIAEQPTEMFDVEGQFEDAATEADAPSDDELAAAELGEPRLAPPEPLTGIEASGPADAEAPPAAEDENDEFDEFFSEQRLSDELNQALEAPLIDEPGAPASEEATAIYEVEVVEPENDLVEEERSDEYEVEDDDAPAPAAEQADDEPPAPPAPAAAHEDVLEDTPEFLEGAPEDDELWFEQKPPKDIDFGD